MMVDLKLCTDFKGINKQFASLAFEMVCNNIKMNVKSTILQKQARFDKVFCPFFWPLEGVNITNQYLLSIQPETLE